MNVLPLERANAILGPKWLFTLLVNFFFAYFFNFDMYYVRCLRNILRSSQRLNIGVGAWVTCIQMLLQPSISYHGDFCIYNRNKVGYSSSWATRRVGEESFLIKQQRPPASPFPQCTESSLDSGGNMIVGALETAVCKGSQELAFFVKGLGVLLLIPDATFFLSLLALSTISKMKLQIARIRCLLETIL